MMHDWSSHIIADAAAGAPVEYIDWLGPKQKSLCKVQRLAKAM